MGDKVIVTRHYLRRRARARAHALERETPGTNFMVERAKRGPYRWYVVRDEYRRDG